MGVLVMARTIKTLTNKQLQAVKPTSKAQKLFDGNGLFLLVSKTGAKGWRFKYRFGGKEKLISIGTYPQTSLAEARQVREDLRAKVRSGIDPSTERKMIKETARIQKVVIEEAKQTFNMVADEYFEHILTLENPPSDDYITKMKSRVKNHVSLTIGATPIKVITRQNVLEILNPLKANNKHETARRTLTLIKNILGFGVSREYVSHNVAFDITPKNEIGKQAKNHYPIITDPLKLSTLLKLLDQYTGDYTTKQALRIMPHVALRPANVRFAEWSEIDFDNKVWTISADKMKMNKAFKLPLTDYVLGVLLETQRLTGGGRYIFSSSIHKDRPVSENTLNLALRRLGYTRDEIVSHSFRGIFSTIAHEKRPEHKCSSLAIEFQLAHKDTNTIRDTYNSSDLFDERVILAEWWSGYLEGLKNVKS